MTALVFSLAGAPVAAAEDSAAGQVRDQAQPSDLMQRLKRAQELLDARQAEQAYALLSEVEFDGAGNVEFDYLLGVAALDAGKPDKATLAFDRVLAVNANYAGALVDRGRAHAALGNLADARADFEAARKLNPSAATRAQLDAFLAQLDRREFVAGAKVKGYLAATLGHDSNVNFAANERNVFLPLLQDSVQLSADSVRQRDAFFGVNGGIALDYVLNPRFAWFASLDAATKRNQDVHQFHLSSLDARFGPAWRRERFQLRSALSLGAMQLGDDDYRKQHGGGLEWRYHLTRDKQLVGALQHTRYRYRSADAKSFDTNQSVGLLGLSFLIGKDKQSVVSPFLLGGYEDDAGGNLQGNKRVTGAGVSGRLALMPWRALSWSLGAQRGRYDKTDPFFLQKRSDKRFDVSLALNQQLGNSKQWLLRPQVMWTRQRSNLAPYDFKRTEAGIMLRRDF
jgi:outer membrane protein